MKKNCFLHSCAVMAAVILLMNAPCTVLASQPEPQDQSVLPDISDPVISPDETSPSGFSVTWDCIYFGSYPTCEVTDSAFTAVEPYAVRDGDVITDPVLYEKLESAEWTDNETELDGLKYRRMQAEDAQNWAEDRPQQDRYDAARVRYFD